MAKEFGGSEGDAPPSADAGIADPADHLYARFPGKEELLAYIEVQLWTDTRTRWAEALEDRDWAGLDFEDAVRRVLVHQTRGCLGRAVDNHKNLFVRVRTVDLLHHL